MAMATWSEEAYAAGRELWQRILVHPFIQELRDGTLPNEKLAYYFEQNTFYIDAAVRARALAGAKAPDLETRDFCFERGPSGQNELQHQMDMLAALGGDPDAEIAPTCRGYTFHLLTIAHSRDTVDLLAAFLPCPWSYDEIGTSLVGKLRNPRHQDWWQFYGSQEHHDLCDRHRAIVDRLTADLSPRRRAQLLDDFMLSLQYEYRFWDMAYTRERWPSDRAVPRGV
jgi:thiaminase/transcriptional activator TenA